MADKHVINQLQESWEEVQAKIQELLKAGNSFKRLARKVEGGEMTAVRFEGYFLNSVENFHNGFGVMFSEESIGEDVEELVYSALNDEEEE